MGIFQDDKPPELYVPANLDKPAAAAVADDGTVACFTCKKRIALAVADIVGQGYRCAGCSQQAAIAGLQGGDGHDAASHLDPRERAAIRRRATETMIGGAAMIVGGVALLPFIVIMKLSGGLIIGGIALISLGYTRKRAMG